LQRRLPKMGFRSRTALSREEIRLNELNAITGEVVDLAALLEAGLIGRATKSAKIIASGSIERALTVRGVGVTKGARAAIEAAGGKVEE
jgi:large subunit ribosomal protein L15